MTYVIEFHGIIKVKKTFEKYSQCLQGIADFFVENGFCFLL